MDERHLIINGWIIVLIMQMAYLILLLIGMI